MFIIDQHTFMGMYSTNYIVVGTQIPRTEYEKQFGSPHKMDDKDNEFVAIGGYNEQWDSIVVGEIKEKMDSQGRMEPQPPTDLVSEYATSKNEISERLEEIGIDDREVSIYLVGTVL